MRHSSLFAPPQSYQERLSALRERLNQNAAILLNVELGFALMEYLKLDGEPVTAVWVILSGMPLRYPTLQNLTPEQRRAIANARQIIPLSSRSAWENALRVYFRDIPEHERNYTVENPGNFDEIIIDACKRIRHKNHQHLYRTWLGETLCFREIQQINIEPGEEPDQSYQFDARTFDEIVNVQVKFENEHLEIRSQFRGDWFDRAQNRTPFSLNLIELEKIAQFLDDHEDRLATQYNWQNEQKGNWLKRYRKIHFHPVVGDQLSADDAPNLELDGFTHIAGMVASGKSTLSLLLAAYLIRQESDRRMTLVVGDVQSALKLANLINWWFRSDPESDNPVAVPLLGHSRRDRHLREFHGSRDYLEHQERGQTHWGERWLRVECPLQALIPDKDLAQKLSNKPIIPGEEPCHSLKQVPSQSQRNARSYSYLCPLFHICPSHQLYRDLPTAQIWITTPGAMAMGRMPRQLESRPIRVGELVYEQSDIVIFDEADTIVKWFDDVYAEEVLLTNGKDGVFDTVGLATERHMIQDRTPNQQITQRWVGAQRAAQQAITVTLTLLSENEILRQWVKKSYFTPNALFYKLSRRLSGLEEFDPDDTPEESCKENEQLTAETVSIFDRLFINETDPLRPQRLRQSDNRVEYSAFRLASLLQEINSAGESAFDDDILANCQAWILEFFPDIEQKLARLQNAIDARNAQQPKKRGRKRKNNEDGDRADTLETLARRLQFALTAALLDRHTHIVFYEWYSRPNSIEGEQPHRRMPSAMLNILPLPPTGRQFGTYYSRGNEDDNNNLSIFSYTNIGRCYVLNSHRLLTDLDGLRGPNVLALSGTSYLPDSTKFHVGDPQGVLMPEETARNAIAESRFAFIPQYDLDGKPIRISGVAEHKKMSAFKELATKLVGNRGTGLLSREIEELKDLGENDEKWRDRDRLLILVNSYDQSKWVADQIRQKWSSQSSKIFHLRRGGVTDDSELGSYFKERDEADGLARANIETFAQTEGKILVAPMHAIGRGFNILNDRGKAAFGAVYFLTRPYPHPHDTQAIAQEVNRRALDWANDPDFIAWLQGDGILQRAREVRKLAAEYWRSVEQRSYYSTLRDDEKLRARPRRDLAATTAGYIIQAVGRLLRGGVPFHAYFVDSAWAPENANPDSEKPDTEKTSLLVAMILCLDDYACDENTVGSALYKPLIDALENMELNW
ncbi:hypothetical protein [Roseofilum capinflatum]|uniref:pPIWI-RE three-gene island domain-containing protein n=1 Tax=Roseofilum capinflatum BLCC-M114 TaxID=3022440 RepID=A0ABT7B864_9CYAN|nr:hypothetical protein [Roseofilum capinflatum]MDJ1175362.1 hypothetical protein [Roseofilum capinflatum BLCC-M114]